MAGNQDDCAAEASSDAAAVAEACSEAANDEDDDDEDWNSDLTAVDDDLDASIEVAPGAFAAAAAAIDSNTVRARAASGRRTHSAEIRPDLAPVSSSACGGESSDADARLCAMGGGMGHEGWISRNIIV